MSFIVTTGMPVVLLIARARLNVPSVDAVSRLAYRPGARRRGDGGYPGSMPV
jgi:hypothetical protein